MIYINVLYDYAVCICLLNLFLLWLCLDIAKQNNIKQLILIDYLSKVITLGHLEGPHPRRELYVLIIIKKNPKPKSSPSN